MKKSCFGNKNEWKKRIQTFFWWFPLTDNFLLLTVFKKWLKNIEIFLRLFYHCNSGDTEVCIVLGFDFISLQIFEKIHILISFTLAILIVRFIRRTKSISRKIANFFAQFLKMVHEFYLIFRQGRSIIFYKVARHLNLKTVHAYSFSFELTCPSIYQHQCFQICHWFFAKSAIYGNFRYILVINDS